MQEYLLLYNFFGYPNQGTKRVLLRCLTETPSCYPVKWRVLSPNHDLVGEGEWKREPRSYGVESWSADFSFVTFSDLYTFHVDFSNGQSMASEPFDVSRSPYLNQLGLRLSIHAAKARYARGTRDGGFYDCNSRMGESHSHGVYLNGLCWFDFLHRSHLTPMEKAELRWAEQETFDYLMKLYNEETGEFRDYTEDRPYDPRNYGIFNTIDALYGLSAYMSLIGSEDPDRCHTASLERLKKSYEFASSHEEKPEALIQYTNSEWLPSIACHLYRFSGEATYLTEARDWLLHKLPEIDLRDLPRGYWCSINLFEGMALVKALAPKTADDPRWTACLDRAKSRIAELMERSAYQFPPPVDRDHSAQAWDHMEELPSASLDNVWNTRWFGNNDVSLWGIQACWLAMLTDDASFANSAAAAINFICGLNFGLPGDMVNPPSEAPLAAASFFIRLPHTVKPWKNWYFRQGEGNWTSIVNGYTVRDGKAFYTDEDFITGETYIMTDGLFLYLITLYERMLHGEDILASIR